MKKITILLAFVLTLFSCTTDQDLTLEQIEETGIKKEQLLSAKTAPNVQLLKAWSQYSFYRGFNTYSRHFKVKVANIAPEKSVSVYHERLDGQWVEIPMEYSYSIDAQSEIWTLQYQHTGEKIYSDEFVIKYDVAGNTYWDDNNGEDYWLDQNEGTLLPENGKNILVDDTFDGFFPVYNTDLKQLNIVVDLKNLALEKSAQVVYSTDGWQTQGTFPLIYTNSWRIGYSYGIQSPNRFDVERWTGSIRVPNTVNAVEYAVVYRVNGEEYWDNNYGKNYLVSSN